MKIDIREADEKRITEIQFADNPPYYSERITHNSGDGTIVFFDCASDLVTATPITDIPNLIKALEKAYELWGKR